MVSHARPTTFSVAARTRASTRGAKEVAAGGAPGFGGDWSVPSAEGNGASEIARPHAAKRGGCFGAHFWIAATIAELRARRAGQPFADARDGMTIHNNTSTPS